MPFDKYFFFILFYYIFFIYFSDLVFFFQLFIGVIFIISHTWSNHCQCCGLLSNIEMWWDLCNKPTTTSYIWGITILFLECDYLEFRRVLQCLSSQYFFTALLEVRTVCGFEDWIYTRLLCLFAFYFYSIFVIVIWLEKLSSCFTALLADNVLQIRSLSMKFLTDYKIK